MAAADHDLCDECDKYNFILCHTSFKGHLECMKAALENGAADLRHGPSDLISALSGAADEGNVDCMILIYEWVCDHPHLSYLLKPIDKEAKDDYHQACEQVYLERDGINHPKLPKKPMSLFNTSNSNVMVDAAASGNPDCMKLVYTWAHEQKIQGNELNILLEETLEVATQENQEDCKNLVYEWICEQDCEQDCDQDCD